MNVKREIGYEKAEEAADHAGYEWKEEAYAAFRFYAIHNQSFTTENVRKANLNMPAPPDQRAWGHVAMRAKRDNIIVSDGLTMADAKPAHGRYVTKWKSLIYQG